MLYGKMWFDTFSISDKHHVIVSENCEGVKSYTANIEDYKKGNTYLVDARFENGWKTGFSMASCTDDYIAVCRDYAPFEITIENWTGNKNETAREAIVRFQSAYCSSFRQTGGCLLINKTALVIELNLPYNEPTWLHYKETWILPRKLYASSGIG